MKIHVLKMLCFHVFVFLFHATQFLRNYSYFFLFSLPNSYLKNDEKLQTEKLKEKKKKAKSRQINKKRIK